MTPELRQPVPQRPAPERPASYMETVEELAEAAYEAVREDVYRFFAARDAGRRPVLSEGRLDVAIEGGESAVWHRGEEYVWYDNGPVTRERRLVPLDVDYDLERYRQLETARIKMEYLVDRLEDMEGRAPESPTLLNGPTDLEEYAAVHDTVDAMYEELGMEPSAVDGTYCRTVYENEL